MDLSRTNQIRQAILYCAADSAHVAEESEQNEPWPTVKFCSSMRMLGGSVILLTVLFISFLLTHGIFQP